MSSVEVAVTPVSVSQSESEAESVKILDETVVESSSVVKPGVVLSVVDFVELDVAPAVAAESLVAVDVDASVANDVESESA